MENLQDFILLFRVLPSNQPPSSEEITDMNQKWSEFIGGIATQAKLINATRLAFDGILIDENLSVVPHPKIVDNEILSGTMTIKAATINEASAMAKKCPILVLGGSVEVRSIIPMES